MAKRFEYKIFQLTPTKDSVYMEAQLNGLGEHGWEVVWADMEYGQILMGREKPEPATDAPDSRTT